MPNDLEARVRDALREQAELHAFVPRDAPRTGREAKRRLIRNAVWVGVLAGLMILGAFSLASPILDAWRPKPESSPSPSITPAGRLAFISRDRHDAGIYSMDVPGSPILVTRRGEFAGWFPDGRSMLIAHGTESRTVLFRMRADGGGAMRFQVDRFQPGSISLRGWVLDTHLKLSPDGTELAIGASETPSGGGRGLYVTDLTLEGSRQIFRGWATEPAWSPDGSQIAFSGPDGKVWIVGADGQGLRPLPLPRDGQTAQEPSWSPDGTRLAMSVEMNEGNVYSHIFIVNSDGSGLTEVPNAGGPPVWSPDGAAITFDAIANDLPEWARRGDRYDLAALDLETSALVPIYTGPGDQLWPVWWFPPGS